MTRRKDGRWQEIITINGKRFCFYGKTKAEVVQKVRNFKDKQEKGMTVSEVSDEWWEMYEPTIEFNSKRCIRPAYKRVIEAFGDRPIKEITAFDIDKFIGQFSYTHADKTCRTQLMVCNHIFRYAAIKGYIDGNIARDVTVPNGLPKENRHMPSSEEIQKVKESYHIPMGMFALFALYTGCRRGELLALEWSDIDMDNRTISVTKSIYHEGNAPKIKKPKTETSIGTLPILNALYDKISPKKSGVVFPDPNTGTYITNKRFIHLWKEYQKQTGVTCTPHQLRHAYATMLFEAGIPPEEAQVLLRHAQISTTMDIYTDIRDGKRKSIFQKVYNIDIQ